MENPQYLKIYHHILNRIRSGELQDGDGLDTEIELTKEFQVSRVTVRKALELLVKEGFLSRKRGKGTVVTLSDGLHTKIPAVGSKENSPSVSTAFRHFIGFILPDISSSYGMKILEGIEKEAEKRGFYLVMKLTKGDQRLEEKAIRDLLTLGASGLIILPQHGEYYNPVIMELSIKNFPFVLVDLELKGLKCSFVGTNNRDASFQAVSYLIQEGHRNIVYLTPPYTDTSALEDRLEGTREAFTEHDLPFADSRILSGFISTMPDNKTPEKIEQDKAILLDYFSNENDITAIFACEYHLALLASVVLKELGIKIPEDISIICFDSPADYLGQYDFTHLRQDEYQMGVLAMEKLDKIMKGDKHIQKIVLHSQLIKGTTTRKI